MINKKIITIICLLLVVNLVAAQVYDTAIAILQPQLMPVKSGYGFAQAGFWVQDSTGYVQDSVTFPATRNYRFDFTGHGLSDITIKIDGVTKVTLTLNSNTDSIWGAVANVTSGRHAVRIAYTDPSTSGTATIHEGLLYIFSSNSSVIIKYPAIVRQSLPLYGSGFINSNHFMSGHLRGWNIGKIIRPNGNSTSTSDFLDIKNYKANILRVWITLESNGTSYSFTPHVIDSLDAFVVRARANGLYLVVVITDLNTDEQFWGSTSLKNSFIARCIDVAIRYKNNTEIASFAITNEPGEQGHLGEFCKFSQDITLAIRRIDTSHIIIFPSMVGHDATEVYTLTEPLAAKNVIYEVHFYEPFEITHQGINAADSIRTEYPNTTSSPYYNASYFGPYGFAEMKNGLKIIRAKAFSDKYNVPIFVGEFTCVDYAPNYSSARWIQDAITIFEGYSWAWTNHGFRVYQPWDQEIPSGRWYGLTFTNAFPSTGQVGFASLEQYRTDTTLSMIILKRYFALNACRSRTR